MSNLSYTAPPTCAQFMKSECFGRIIMGPVGSGKTVSCIMELLRRAMNQGTALDGLRYTRFAIVRQTLKQLKDTVLKDCNQWLGGIGEWKVSEGTFHVRFNDVISEWVFIPLENADDQARLLSMQLTGAWLSEVIEMDVSILGPIAGRMPRFPSASKGVPSWFGIIADTNFPTEMTPWHKFMEEPPPDWQVFKQPSGLAPDAENLNWLAQTEKSIQLPVDHPVRLAQGRTYYERYINMFGADHDWVKRYVYAMYGDDPSGTAIFRETFKTSFHTTAEETLLIPGYPIIIGQDFGRDPWSVICQADHLGRLIVHEEVAVENMGIEQHIQRNLRPALMRDKYLNYKVALVGDPSGEYGSQTTEETCFQIVKRLGLMGIPAPTNDLEPRIRAVEAFLGRQVNGGPALIINREKCPKLVRAMSGGYRFGKRKDGQAKPKPDKNEFSHVADALQYACMVANGGLLEEIARRLRPRPTRVKRMFSSSAWT